VEVSDGSLIVIVLIGTSPVEIIAYSRMAKHLNRKTLQNDC
jgi:hypothetical protein